MVGERREPHGVLGKATARLLASCGLHLALHYFSQSEVTTALAEELHATDVRIAAFQADLADFDTVRTLHAKVVEEIIKDLRCEVLRGSAECARHVVILHVDLHSPAAERGPRHDDGVS